MSMLPDAARFKRLVDGSARGPLAAAARLGLATAAVPYGWAVAARTAAYDRGLFPVHAAPVPVISVGNLSLGGTGKTPLVAWVVRRLVGRCLRPAIVSRGYAAKPGTRSDEAAELALLLPDIPHHANRDRVAAARAAAETGSDVIVLDDGFQHRRLARQFDIVAVDATDPFGCGRLFPRGLLREPVAAIGRGHAVVLTRSDAVTMERRREIRAELNRRCRGQLPAIWVEAEHRAIRLRSFSGATAGLDAVRGQRIAACAAIGNPAAFQRTLHDLGGHVVDVHSFADHHHYTDTDVDALARSARAATADICLTTLKDLVKLRRDEIGGRPLFAVEIRLECLSGGDELAAAIVTAGRGATA